MIRPMYAYRSSTNDFHPPHHRSPTYINRYYSIIKYKCKLLKLYIQAEPADVFNTSSMCGFSILLVPIYRVNLLLFDPQNILWLCTIIVEPSINGCIKWKYLNRSRKTRGLTILYNMLFVYNLKVRTAYNVRVYVLTYFCSIAADVIEKIKMLRNYNRNNILYKSYKCHCLLLL